MIVLWFDSFFCVANRRGGAHGVLHQHRDGHRADAAGIGRDFAGNLLDGGKIHVADQRAVLPVARG